MTYEYVHECERKTIEHQPGLGMDDVSKCLPGWVRSLCDAFEKGIGISLSHDAVSNLAHTLIAARRRQHRLIDERDELEDARDQLVDRLPD